MKKEFYELAWEQIEYWQNQDKKTLKKISKLLSDIERNGNSGLGHPEPLKGNLSGWWTVKLMKKIGSYIKLRMTA